MCVVCRQTCHKQQLHKITRHNNVWQVDKNYTVQGRSIYVHKTDECMNKFSKMNKRFKIENFEQLFKELNE